MTRPEINIVLTTWNALEYTKTTIESLYKSTKISFILTIIDNGSNIETVNYLKTLEPQNSCIKIEKIFNNKNLGPGHAFNQGWEVSKKENAEFTCLINNDLYFADSWLESLLNEMNDAKIGAVAPIGISQYSRYFDGIRNSREVFENMPKNLSPEREIEAYFEGEIDKNINLFCKNNESQIFDKVPSFLPSHCLLIRNDITKNIGFIADPVYETYGCDDVDLSWEILKRGYLLKISNSTFVYHFRHKSISENNLDRKKSLVRATEIFLKKWRKEIKTLKARSDFFEKFFDLDNQSFAILRKMNQKCNFLTEDSLIFAAFACLGKTEFSKKYPHLSIDLETSNFRYLYPESPDNIEQIKSTKNRTRNSIFPNNYVREIGKCYGKKAIIFIALSPEIMGILDGAGVKYSVVYPEKNMTNAILNRARIRGNNEDFIKLLENNLSTNTELDSIKSRNLPKRVIIAKNNDTLESILKSDKEIRNISLKNSSFTYKDVFYSVIFESLLEKNIPDKKWSQVYVVGKIQNQIPIVKYNKKGVVSFNLPGGGVESGENAEETLRREILEELNMKVLDFSPLGYQVNTTPEGEKFYQLRFFANLEKVGEFEKDIGGSVVGYKLENIKKLNSRINWGEVGDWFSLVLQDNYEK